MTKNKENNFVDKKIIAKEIELGFLRVPSSFKNFFPSETKDVILFLGKNAKKSRKQRWNKKHQRVFGLTSFYKRNKAKPGDLVRVELIREGEYRLFFVKKKEELEERDKLTKEEAEEILDLSELSSQAKGDIVEDRIKELILLYGQGLLNVYKPTNDTEGIDLVVIKKGVYQPIFLQVKSNFKLHSGRNLIVQVSEKTLNPHHTFFIVGAYFNPQEVEIHDKILFVPSRIIKKDGNPVGNKSRKYYRATVSLLEGSNAKFTDYLVPKVDFVNKILEKFEEIEQYYK